MRVVVASLGEGCLAHRALEQEGVEHSERVCRGDHGYGRLVAELWADGEGFVLVEHDVVPWVGAISQMEDCPGDWCGFRYAKCRSTVRALGLVKFSDDLVGAYPELSRGWAREPWQTLESAVLRAVHSVVEVCKHGPPAGHVK